MHTIEHLDIAPWLAEFLRGLFDTSLPTVPNGTVSPPLSLHLAGRSAGGSAATLEIEQTGWSPGLTNSSISGWKPIPKVASIPLPNNPPEMQAHYLHAVSKAVDLRIQVAELESHLADHIERISLSYEELTFLRRMGEHIQYCQVDQKVESVAQAILSTLRDIVRAESVCFIQPVPGASAFRIAAQDGKSYPAERLCEWLRESYPESFWERPIVENCVSLAESDGNSPRIQRCLVVPVDSQASCCGWLLAINKFPAPAREDRPTFIEQFVNSESEFGTNEATLMSCVATTLATHARNRALFREKEVLLINMIRTLVNTLDARDPYTCGHSERVAQMAARIARELDWPSEECEQVYLTGLLHDLGKIGVPDEVLRKAGRLTEKEFALIRQHPELGYHILKDLKQLDFVLPGVLHHHERMDGKGYPHQLRGEEIPLVARILAVVDSFDAMTSHRPYRRGMPYTKAAAILKADREEQWDPEILGLFFALQGEMHEICRQDAAQRAQGLKSEYKKHDALFANSQ